MMLSVNIRLWRTSRLSSFPPPSNLSERSAGKSMASNQLLIASSTELGITAPYFGKAFDKLLVPGGPEVAEERESLYNSISDLACSTESEIVKCLKIKKHESRGVAREALREGSIAHCQLMLQSLLLDRISGASRPYEESLKLKQRHYIEPQALDDTVAPVWEKYVFWNNTLLDYCKDWVETYNEASYEGPEAQASIVEQQLGSERLMRAAAGLCEGLALSGKRKKVSNSENNLIFAALGLIALMLVSHSKALGVLTTHFCLYPLETVRKGPEQRRIWS
jgi:hypothetical protein